MICFMLLCYIPEVKPSQVTIVTFMCPSGELSFNSKIIIFFFLFWNWAFLDWNLEQSLVWISSIERPNKYSMRAIISCGLYIFYPIFHCGLYCRAVNNTERLIFRDSFFATKNRADTASLTLLLSILHKYVRSCVL